MSLLFSHVRITADGDTDEFLVGGIIREADDLDGYTAFDEIVSYLAEDTEMLVHSEIYLYGEGEAERASLDDLAYLQSRMDNDAGFLNCSAVDNIESVDFSFIWSPEEQFEMEYDGDEADMEM